MGNWLARNRFVMVEMVAMAGIGLAPRNNHPKHPQREKE
jgi:hypothetical protein